MLGTALQRVLADRGDAFVAPPESEFDITDADVVVATVAGFASANPGGLVVNAAAYTNVERAEDDEKTAYAVNEDGARLLAQAAHDAGLGFVHVSTDFVFEGCKTGAYVETDAVKPLSVYGASKLAGELAVAEAYPEALIARTAWVFGSAGENFPVKILRAARANPRLRVVTDEVGSPTYTVDLAAGILALAAAGAGGLFHLAWPERVRARGTSLRSRRFGWLEWRRSWSRSRQPSSRAAWRVRRTQYWTVARPLLAAW
jgi:dTDP-4-dehydrorhamnose reductase